MPMNDQGLKKELLETNEEFRHLFEQHQAHERRLEELHAKSLPAPEDELEEKQIKLQKLHLKDQMQAILRGHRGAVTPV